MTMTCYFTDEFERIFPIEIKFFQSIAIIYIFHDLQDYLDEDVGDDVMMEDDSKSTASTSTEFSTGSSVGSNTPSLIGENLESFCLGETEKGAASEGINLNILLLLWDVD